MVWVAFAFALEVPLQGHVTDAVGAPVHGTHQLVIRLFSDAGATAERYAETQSVVFASGTFGTHLGVAASLSPALFETWPSLWVTVQVDGGAPSAPVALATVPYAAVAERARDAALLDGQDSTAFAAASHAHDGAYVALGGSYADPSWITSLAASKLGWGTQAAGSVLAAPAGAAGTPSFRRLTAADLGTGTPSAGSVLRGDGTWGAPRVPEDNGACGASSAGTMRLRSQRFLDICVHNGSAWTWTTIVSGGNDGSSPSLAAPSCKAILDWGLSTGDKAYFILPSGAASPVQTWCDMTNGGWTLIAKFSAAGSDWSYGSTNWTTTSTLNTNLLANTTTVGSAKSPAFNLSAFSEYRLDGTGNAPGTGRMVTFNAPVPGSALQAVFASGTAYTLTVTAGDLSAFAERGSNFQGNAGSRPTGARVNSVAGITFSGSSCETAQNRVRLGVNYGCYGCGSDANGGANTAYVGLGGSTIYRDGHAGSCASYATSAESFSDTSGDNSNLWGR